MQRDSNGTGQKAEGEGNKGELHVVDEKRK